MACFRLQDALAQQILQADQVEFSMLMVPFPPQLNACLLIKYSVQSKKYNKQNLKRFEENVS